jgi:cytochrome c
MKSQLMLAAILAGIATTAVAAPPTGQQVFEQRCTVCHSLQPAPGKMGPPLAGVVGRKAGTAPGFAYSTR